LMNRIVAVQECDARDDDQNYLSRLNNYFLIGEIASADLAELELYCIVSASQ